jgi:hypothetical protein
MNATNDTDASTAKSDRKSVASKRNAKRALAAVSEYVSRVLAASALTMWGALNLIVSIRNLFVVPTVDGEGPSGPWWITLAFVLVTAVLPFLIGLNMFRQIYQQTKVR